MAQEETVPMPAAVVLSCDMLPESPRKAKAPARQLSVPPPPGWPSVTPAARSFSRARAVQPEDDPFVAAYLACTRRNGGKDGSREHKQGRRRFAWAGLGLSCKGSAGAAEHSMVKLAKRPELDPRDA
ncbi:uncharacterized protein LOC133904256 [Phragmites australis]|uniref:uncharacterized protein LOC133904256 n=1 Tax=Phragmites australis TaxID=29695 RepID=UPI002D7A0AD2|nr:uncharacterized protein LOC133904256 [Phragmites australis]